MARKLTDVRRPKRSAEPFVDVKVIEKRPVLGMTMLKLKGAYSMDALAKLSKRDAGRDVYQELQDLQKSMYTYENMSSFMKDYHTKYGEYETASQDALRREKKRLRELFALDLSGFQHIHTRPRGNGKFTLIGFVYDNVFEVLMLDPEHAISKR